MSVQKALASCLILGLIYCPLKCVQAAPAGAAVSVSSGGGGGAIASSSSTRMRSGNVVEGITDAVARSSERIVNAGTDNLLTGTDGFAKLYKDTVGRPMTTAGVAVQNVATSMSNANKVMADGIRAGIDDTYARPMASIGSTYENLLASGGAASGAWFDNAITKPFSLFGAATRDLFSSSFPSGSASTTTTTVEGDGSASAAAASAPGGGGGAASTSSTGSSSSSVTSTSTTTSSGGGGGAAGAVG